MLLFKIKNKFISFSNLISKAAGIPIPKKDKIKQTETVTVDNKEYVGK